MEFEMKNVELDKICRTCLVDNGAISLFEEDSKNITLHVMLTTISGIELSRENGLPSSICSECLRRINEAFAFRQQCERNEMTLQEFVSKNKSVLNVKRELETTFAINNAESDEESFNHFMDSEDCEIKYENTDGTGVFNEKIRIKIEAKHKRTEKTTTCIKRDNAKFRQKIIAKNKNLNAKTKKTVKKANKTDEKKHEYYPPIEPLPMVTENEFGEKIFSCYLCNKKLQTQKDLIKHNRTHDAKKPFICPECGQKYRNYVDLCGHMWGHRGVKPYKCELCGNEYKHSNSLIVHIRSHTGERPYKCTECPKSFKHSTERVLHMRSHTKEKPYICPYCGIRKSMSFHMTIHIRTHTGERPFKCPHCDKAFTSGSLLKNHIVIHTGVRDFICNICNKAFSRKTNLRVHSMIHTDKRPHVCRICGKGFIQAHVLNSHMNTHVNFNK